MELIYKTGSVNVKKIYLANKMKIIILAVFLLAIMLCIAYFTTPIRPAIANITANRYIQNHYQQYNLPPSEILSVGYSSYYRFTWVTSYGAQSMNDDYFASVTLNGWFPFIVQQSTLWENQNGEDVQIQP